MEANVGSENIDRGVDEPIPEEQTNKGHHALKKIVCSIQRTFDQNLSRNRAVASEQWKFKNR